MTHIGSFPKDVHSTAAGDLHVTCFGHASLGFAFGGKTIYADPFSNVADYSNLPRADVILITHHHFDHFDLQAIAAVRAPETRIVYTAECAGKLPGGIVLANGEAQTVGGVPVHAVPAYNVVHKRESGDPYHIPGQGNGYLLTFGGQRVYIAGDTENIPEMKRLAPVDIAFLPVNVPYTMSPEMAADAARMIRPRILYPYHSGDTDLSRLVELLRADTEIEIRIRKTA